MTNSEYIVKNVISPDMHHLKELLSEWVGINEFTYINIMGAVKSKKHICMYEAYENGEIVGLLTAWESDFHPYCTYFSIALKPFLNFKAEAMLLESLEKTQDIYYPLQTSIWETSYRLKTFYEGNEFKEKRKTYMPILNSIKVDVNLVFGDVLAPDLIIRDFDSIKNNELLRSELIKLVKENYSKTHSINPVGEHDLNKWEKLIFNHETILKGSYFAKKDDDIIAYSLLHFSEAPYMYEFGWRGTREQAEIRIMLLLTALQVNFAADNSVDMIEAEVDSTDHFAIEMLKFFPFSPASALLTFQKKAT